MREAPGALAYGAPKPFVPVRLPAAVSVTSCLSRRCALLYLASIASGSIVVTCEQRGYNQ